MPCTSLSVKYNDAPFSSLLFLVRDRSQIGRRTIMAGGAKDLPSLTLASLWLFTEALRRGASDNESDARSSATTMTRSFPPSIGFLFPPQINPCSFICSASQSLDADYRWDFFFSLFHATSNTPFKERKHSLLEDSAVKIEIFSYARS